MKRNWKKSIGMSFTAIFLMACAANSAYFTDGFESYDIGDLIPNANGYGWFVDRVAEENKYIKIIQGNSPFGADYDSKMVQVGRTGTADGLQPRIYNYFGDKSTLGVVGSVGQNLTGAGISISWDVLITDYTRQPKWEIRSGEVNAIDFQVRWDTKELRYYNGSSYVDGTGYKFINNVWYRFELSNIDVTNGKWDLDVLAWDTQAGEASVVVSLSNVSFFNSVSSLEHFRMFSNSSSAHDFYIDNFKVAQFGSEIAALCDRPRDGAVEIDIFNTSLRWGGYPGTTAYQVYFGTTPQLDAPGDYKGEQTAESFALDALEAETTYYWRIDSVYEGDIYEGEVWSFTTVVPMNEEIPRNLAYEGFDYAPGTLGTAGSGGIGWSSSWQRGVDTNCPLNIGQGSLAPGMDYILGTKGNRVWAIGEKYAADYHGGARQLQYPIDMRIDQDYYISYLVKCDSDTFNQASMWISDSKMGGNVLLAAHQYEAGHHATLVATPKFALRSPTNDWYNRLFGSWSSEEVYMVIVKISAVAAGNDTVSIKIFNQSNPLPFDEPTEWDASFTTQSNLAYSWLKIDGVGDQFDLWNFDEIHIGTGWGAVTGWAQVCGDFGTIMPYDLNEDCTINIADYALMAADWLKCTDPAIDGCEWVIMPGDPNFVGLFTSMNASSTRVYETGGVTVDGSLDDWNGSRWYEARFLGGYNAANASDISDARLSLKWDPSNPQYVYAAVKVIDTNRSFASNPTTWNAGDNLEIRFSANSTSTDTAWYSDSTFDTAQYYQIFPLSPSGYLANLGSIVNQRNAGTYTDIDYAVAVNGDEIVYEIAIPAYLVYNINTQSGTKATLGDGDVIAFNIQINSVNGELSGGLFNNQSHNPQDWAKFTVTANSSLVLGDMGFFAGDIDRSGVVGSSDLMILIDKWLSCTDPEQEGCEQPWMP